jgi:hypothetical protein
MTPDQLELAITHYLDGTLPPEDIGALEQILATDPVAQAIFQEHEKLTAVLRSQPLPEMDMGELARDLSAVVTGTVDEESRLADQKLNAILKAVTPLPTVKWDELAARISASLDEELAAGDEEDARLDILLQSNPMPALDWDKLAIHLSKAVAAETGGVEAQHPRQEEEKPAVLFKIGFAQKAARWAVAACLVGAAAVGIRMYSGHADQTHVVSQRPTPVDPAGPVVAQVEIPKVEESNKPAVAEISIGPSKAYAEASDQGFYPSGVASRSPVVIAVPVGSDDDADHILGFD